jgi:glycosyltransferase involved in cell wall biosynthesis
MNFVIILGTMPPPIGGVTIHIDRFFNLYKNSNKFELAVLDIKKRTLFLKDKQIKNISKIFLYFIKSKIVHIHISNCLVKLFFAMISKFLLKKVIYTHHNSLINNEFIFKVMYKICDKVILVNDKEISKKIIIESKTEIIPAFLPPYKFEDLPEWLEKKIKLYDNIISSNCYYFSLINNKHIYGFDVIIDAFYKLSKHKKIQNSILILVDPSNTTQEFISNFIENKDFGSNEILFVGEKIDFASLIKKSDVTIRATRTDGDSLSVRESLYFNVPVIASDVTVRPKGTILFKNEDSEDLADKIAKVLKNKQKLKHIQEVNFGEKIMKVYENVLYK